MGRGHPPLPPSNSEIKFKVYISAFLLFKTPFRNGPLLFIVLWDLSNWYLFNQSEARSWYLFNQSEARSETSPMNKQ